MGNSVSQSLDGQATGSGRCGWYNKSNVKQLYPQLKEGDLVEFNRKTYCHWAVCVEVSEKWAMVIHINMDTAIIEQDLEEVLGENECRINNRYDDHEGTNSGPKTVERARFYLKFPKGFGPYNIATNNCEHLANLCRYNERRSGQVRVAVVAGVAGTVAGVTLAAAVIKAIQGRDNKEEELKHK